MNIEQAKLLFSVIGYVGAFVVFVIGLWQYRRAQQWKRAEFLANEIKQLTEDDKASCALTMIDWAARRLRLLALEDPRDETRTVVTYEMQCIALQPHTLVGSTVEGESDVETAEDGTKLRRFTREQALIRDSYDALLDRWDRMGAYLDRRLMKVTDMAPYVGYYINDIATPTADPTEALWMLSLLTYISFYHFTGVITLFRAFGHDIRPRGQLFAECVRNAGLKNAQLAAHLAELAHQEALRSGAATPQS